MGALTIAGTLLSGGRAVAGTLTVEDGLIVEVELGARSADLRHGGYIAPGLCDLQVNGAAGHEVTEGDAALDAIEARLLEAGVTAYLPTVVTAPEEVTLAAVARLAPRAADPASPVQGVHLEGPLLNPRFAGAHDPGLLCGADEGLPAAYDDPVVRMVTLAPEVPGGRGAVRQLARRGVVVSLGHSAATAEQADAAAEAGARAVTHVFNAMATIHQRAPGLVGRALVDERLVPTVIADWVHLDPLVLQLIDRAVGERVVLISDAAPPAGAPEGTYVLAGLEIERRGDEVAAGDGTLTGSALLLDRMVRRWRAATGCTPAAAWAAASDRPAALIGAPAGLVVGRTADLVLLDHELAVERVMFRGEWL